MDDLVVLRQEVERLKDKVEQVGERNIYLATHRISAEDECGKLRAVMENCLPRIREQSTPTYPEFEKEIHRHLKNIADEIEEALSK